MRLLQKFDSEIIRSQDVYVAVALEGTGRRRFGLGRASIPHVRHPFQKAFEADDGNRRVSHPGSVRFRGNRLTGTTSILGKFKNGFPAKINESQEESHPGETGDRVDRGTRLLVGTVDRASGDVSIERGGRIDVADRNSHVMKHCHIEILRSSKPPPPLYAEGNAHG